MADGFCDSFVSGVDRAERCGEVACFNAVSRRAGHEADALSEHCFFHAVKLATDSRMLDGRPEFKITPVVRFDGL